jgi:hypothetical protein
MSTKNIRIVSLELLRFGGNRKSDQHTLSTNIKEKILMRVSSAALFKFLNWKMFSEEICEI